jgi:predicted RNA binding protein YcfA (HicA-like mRNA interferase family)
MSKLPVIKPKEVINALKKAGFVEIRTKGSHVHLKKVNLLVTVPFHNKDLEFRTLKSILRQSKLTAEELRKLL